MPKTLKNEKIKRTQKIKDVNAPKQPMNAYFFFLKDKRSDFKATHSDLKSTEIVKSLNKRYLLLAT
ncbi:HMG-box domain-containing protein [Spiroplasma endosymbiont of Danaus chrysippus]|uniref:HMG-box domain-containing protein n=1 Tax=Spiroplasma endosymbiont of Danaus chrysippus TaxID=2691041 RepID=UPI00157ABC4B|nr:HMG-box domain-containing protein [Spiroplasma endosymbiont of Danaus chrysippus]